MICTNEPRNKLKNYKIIEYVDDVIIGLIKCQDTTLHHDRASAVRSLYKEQNLSLNIKKITKLIFHYRMKPHVYNL